MITTATALPLTGWSVALEAAGFEPTDRRGRFRHLETGVLARFDGERWLILTAPRALGGTAGAGPYGLWKPVEPGAVALDPVWRCDLPRGFGEGAIDPGDDPELQTALLDWCLASLTGRPLRDWSPPPVTVQRQWAGDLAWSVEAHGCIRQIEPGDPADTGTAGRLICEVARLPEVQAFPAARARFVRHAVRHAQRAFRMVRVEWQPGTRSGPASGPDRILAVLDYRGVPPGAAEAVFATGMQAVHLVVRWLAPLTAVLADPALELKAIELAP